MGSGGAAFRPGCTGADWETACSAEVCGDVAKIEIQRDLCKYGGCLHVAPATPSEPLIWPRTSDVVGASDVHTNG
jgi:hypothetical protein